MNNNIFNFFSFYSMLSGSYGDSLEDIMYCLNDKVRDLRLSLTFEVIELYEDKGYTYEEISYMIDNSSLDNENLTKEEIEYLKRDAKKVLDIRKSLKEKSKTKIKEKENDIYE